MNREKKNLELQLQGYVSKQAAFKSPKRWISYASAVGAASAVVSAPSVCQAIVVNVPIPGGGNPGSAVVGSMTNMNNPAVFSFDMDGDGTVDFVFRAEGTFTSPATSMNPNRAAVELDVVGGAGVILAGGNPAKLASGANIAAVPGGAGVNQPMGVATNTGGGADNLTGNWTTAGLGFLGVRLSGGALGWIELRVDQVLTGTPNRAQFTVTRAAYESAVGNSINAGQTTGGVPEPASTGLGLLALGAAGVASLRKRKKKKQQPQDA